MRFNDFVVFITVCLSYSVHAGSDTDIKLRYLQYMLDCAQQHSVATEDFKEIAKQKVLKNDNAKCMFACVFKKTGMTDENGYLSVEGVNQVAEMAYANNPEKMKQSEEFTKVCVHVNAEELSGEKQECQRAALIFKCSVDNAAGSVV